MKIDVDKKGFATEHAMPPVATILLVAKEVALYEWAITTMRQDRYKVVETDSVSAAQSALQKGVDLIVLDHSSDDEEGIRFVCAMRERGVSTPVVFVSDKTKEADIEAGFRCGGDDYLKKPFSIKELLYRIKAILRRTHVAQCEKLKVRDIVMDFNARRVFVHHTEALLTRLEFKLLEIFLKNKNKVLERDYLLASIWCDNRSTQKRTINVTINRLKKKIDPLNEKNYIVPVRGLGYKFQ
jgi:DNA-binding response OmpR family regulator